MKSVKLVLLPLSLALLAACGEQAGDAQTASAPTTPASTPAPPPPPPPVEPFNAVLSIDPARIQVCDGSFRGQATVNWVLSGERSDRDVRLVVVEENGTPETARSSGSGSTVTGKWLQNGTRMRLVDGQTGATLAEATAEVHSEQCPGVVFTGPVQAADCDGDGVAIGTYTWDTTGVSEWVELHAVKDGQSSVWATGNMKGSATTENWLSNGTTIEMRNSQGKELLARVEVTLETASCAAQ